jgi:putative NADPH-quinone reductase
MGKRIVIIQGHPDVSDKHFGHALAREYAAGAEASGHEVRVINVAALDFPLLRSKEDFEHASAPDSIRGAQEAIRWADHLVIFHPLWLGMMPALLKAFLEQALRPGFAFAYSGGGARMPKKLLAGKSARIVITMGMPALVYHWFFGAHGLKCLKRNILGFCGFGPIRQSLVGMVESGDGTAREKWLARMRNFGRDGQ